MQRSATTKEIVEMNKELRNLKKREKQFAGFERALDRAQALCPGMGKMYGLLSETRSILRSCKSSNYSAQRKLEKLLEEKVVKHGDDE